MGNSESDLSPEPDICERPDQSVPYIPSDRVSPMGIDMGDRRSSAASVICDVVSRETVEDPGSELKSGSAMSVPCS